MTQVVILDNEDVTYILEDIQGLTFAHLEIHRWSSRVFRRLVRVLDATLQQVGSVHVAVWNSKLEKFVKMLKFKDTGHTITAKWYGSEDEIIAKHFVREL